jgi:glutaredoxin
MEWSHRDRTPFLMVRRRVVLVAATLAALSTLAQAQALYRYLDATGRVVYSDQPPPPSARDVQPKRLPENVIETDPVPLATRQAAARFPVTLYTFDCGDVCRDAQALLAKRGVPHETVIVSEEKGATRLKTLTGKQSAPVLQIGDKQVIEGYNEERWQAGLDQAGYPKNAPPLRAPPARAAAAAPAAAAPPVATPPVNEDTTPPARGHDYPK